MSTSTLPEPALMEAVPFAEPPRATFGRLTPVFLVDRVEPCVAFWAGRLGFEPRLAAPGPDGLDFVLLARDDVQLIYRTRESVRRLSPEAIDDGEHAPWVILHLSVSDLDALLPRLDGVEVVVPLRESDFGVRELYIREPSGRLVALVEQA